MRVVSTLCCQTIWLGGSLANFFFVYNVFYKVSMPGESPYNNWGLAGGLPPGSLTLNNYSVTMPNSHHFSDESDSAGTARTGNRPEFDLGSRSRVHYSLAPENFEDAPYVPPRSGQSLPHPYPTHTHTSHNSDEHTVSNYFCLISFSFFLIFYSSHCSSRVLPNLIIA